MTVDQSMVLSASTMDRDIRPTAAGITGASSPVSQHITAPSVGPCHVCVADTRIDDALFCTSCDLLLHQKCIGSLLMVSGTCPCGNGVRFERMTPAQARKRQRESSGDDQQLRAPALATPPVQGRPRKPLKDFFVTEGKKATIASLMHAMAGWAEETELREQERDAANRQLLKAVAQVEHVTAANSNRIGKLETVVDRHEARLSIFEIIAAGIPGDRIPDIKRNFLAIAAYLEVPLTEVDIADVRYMKRDQQPASPKIHTVIFRLHESKSVAALLLARKGTPSARPNLSLRTIFPQANMPDHKLFLRPLLSSTTVELLKKAKAARASLGFKYAWGDDRGVIWMKRDEQAQPIQIYNLRSLERLSGGVD